MEAGAGSGGWNYVCGSEGTECPPYTHLSKQPNAGDVTTQSLLYCHTPSTTSPRRHCLATPTHAHIRGLLRQGFHGVHASSLAAWCAMRSSTNDEMKKYEWSYSSRRQTATPHLVVVGTQPLQTLSVPVDRQWGRCPTRPDHVGDGYRGVGAVVGWGGVVNQAGPSYFTADSVRSCP